MLSSFAVRPTLPAQDLERAKTFYGETLGLTAWGETMGGCYFECGHGSRLRLFRSKGKPSGEHSQMGFLVDDLKAEVADLKGRGVVFEEYDFPGLTTEDSIADMGDEFGAWFKDSEGNLVALGQLKT
jgi:catechol 2,3-dioxygenase-like lactoylglutathione lyase family enzyme